MSRLGITAPLLLVASCIAGFAQSKPANSNIPSISAYHDPAVQAAYEHFYNLDYDRATQDFEKLLEKHPDDPVAVNHLLTALLMHELYRMGAMNTGEYANDTFIGQAHRQADPKVKERIKQLVSRAETLEDSTLKAQPKNVEALYCRGVTRAQYSLYTALIERAWFSALHNAVGARHDNERVLELNPNFIEAKLIVGAHNYVMGSLPWSVKVAVALVGLSGSKEKGLQYLREVANGGAENSVDAKVVLCLFLRREHAYDEALGEMKPLVARYPRNYLFALEQANLLRAAGRTQEAAAEYRQIWQNGHEGKYDNLHYEMAAWGLGELLRNQKDYAGAAAAFELVNEAPNPDPETLQKANLAAGEMYDLLQKRDLAKRKYQTVLAENGGTPPAEEARKHLRDAYRE
ncbi:MAG TPA: tetratricopeptide repeat protein [Candidatus Sulfotelmatobacter sp.]|nr:tetratricopeptide repeat protein [Candidatus Sulfotelmatobacter sp.]